VHRRGRRRRSGARLEALQRMPPANTGCTSSRRDHTGAIPSGSRGCSRRPFGVHPLGDTGAVHASPLLTRAPGVHRPGPTRVLEAPFLFPCWAAAIPKRSALASRVACTRRKTSGRGPRLTGSHRAYPHDPSSEPGHLWRPTHPGGTGEYGHFVWTEARCSVDATGRSAGCHRRRPFQTTQRDPQAEPAPDLVQRVVPLAAVGNSPTRSSTHAAHGGGTHTAARDFGGAAHDA
jgi:hypothetical protein